MNNDNTIAALVLEARHVAKKRAVEVDSGMTKTTSRYEPLAADISTILGGERLLPAS